MSRSNVRSIKRIKTVQIMFSSLLAFRCGTAAGSWRGSLSRLYLSRRREGLSVVAFGGSDYSGYDGSFVKRLDKIYPHAPCLFCNGVGKVPCERCDGKGVIGKGGYQKKNPVDMDRIIGSKWTAMETTFGWRHFSVASKQRGAEKVWFLELVATCDKSTRFWVNAKNLQDRERWAMGWLQRSDILNAKGTSSPCKYCRGEGWTACETCGEQNDKYSVIYV